MAKMTKYCKAMRKKPTPAEKKMKTYLQRWGIRFRSQRPIDYYIVDFLLFTKRVIIEVDGKYHDNPDQKKKDQYRQRFLEKKGFDVIRVTNDMVISDNMEWLRRYLKSKKDFNIKDYKWDFVYGKAHH